jgi:hypothetical protein
MLRIAGIATLKEREESFKRVIESLYPQVDHIYAILNYYDSIPSWLIQSNITPVLMNNEYKDSGKFLYANIPDVVYFGCDDDLLYPIGYCDYMEDGVRRYNGLVSLHGKKYLPPVSHFKKWAGSYRCLGTVSENIKVNVVGSGCCAFSTERLSVDISQFKIGGMADIWLSKLASEQGVPIMVLKHNIGYLQYTNITTPTIWGTTKDYTEHTKILRSFIK